MKIAVAQSESTKGDINKNISNHLKLIELVDNERPSAVFFPELSITGYEPELAQQLATTPDDKRLDVFQKLCDKKNMVIGVGLPTTGESKPHISMAIFQPYKTRLTYSKQYLHPGEEKYFDAGKQQVFVELGDTKIAPAICYESSVAEHQMNAVTQGANIYVASVLNSKMGIDKEMKSLSEVASSHNVIVMMSNYIGESGGYAAAGMSSVWNNYGDSVGKLNEMEEGLLIFDTDTKLSQKVLV